MNQKPLVEVNNISKKFGATVALNQVSFQFYAGEIFALVGANGAGKSTLIKIICGYYADYAGEIRIHDQGVHFFNPTEAHAQGIRVVHQIINQSVVLDMSIAENLALGELLTAHSSFWYQRNAIKKKAEVIAQQMQLKFKDFSVPVRNLEQSERQMIALARTLASKPKLLILDEPTSSISEKEAVRLFAVLQSLKEMGVAIVYVSHKLHEIERIADRVGVLRDGMKGDVLQPPFTVRQMVASMVGAIHIQKKYENGKQIEQNKIKLELKNLQIEKKSPPIDLKIHQGEIIGMTGLIGAGKSELAQVLFGMKKPHCGQILIDGEPIHLNSINHAIDRGIFLVPEDRSTNAILPEFSIRHNITFPFIKWFSNPLGILKKDLEQSESQRMIEAIGVKCAGDSASIFSLSGGNQQKVVVARWLMKDHHVLILDEPFQGVDIKSRHDISEHLRQTVKRNAIILICADLDEILHVADRIVVLNHGQVAGTQRDYEFDRAQLLQWIAHTSKETTKNQRIWKN